MGNDIKRIPRGFYSETLKEYRQVHPLDKVASPTKGIGLNLLAKVF